MKKALKSSLETYYYNEDGTKVNGVPVGISGNLSGIRGNLTGISGDLDDCELTDSDRKQGVNVRDLLSD